MALIKCPECGKDVSNKAPACIHCGYPLGSQVSTAISKKVVIPGFKEPADNKVRVIAFLRKELNRGLSTIKDLVEQDNPVIKDGLTQEQAEALALKLQNLEVDAKILDSSTPLPTEKTKDDRILCPYCGSSQYHAGARGYGFFTGFLGSGQTVLTCLKCGRTWRPGWHQELIEELKKSKFITTAGRERSRSAVHIITQSKKSMI